MDVPETVKAALSDRPVAGRVCLEAGAGVGNTTAGLLESEAARVYAVTNNREHAKIVHERVSSENTERVAVLEADLRDLPLATDSIELITAHGLFNVLPPASLGTVATELTRVASPNCHLVIDDYEPIPADAAVRELFALENAATELATGRPAVTFYPPMVLQRLFVGYGWVVDREKVLLDPVPWTTNHLKAHTDITRMMASKVAGELEESLTEATDSLIETIDSESVGKMYSIALHLPD